MIEELDTRPLDNLHARFEDPRWREVDPSLPHSPPLTVRGEQRAGFAQGAAVGTAAAAGTEGAQALGEVGQR